MTAFLRNQAEKDRIDRIKPDSHLHLYNCKESTAYNKHINKKYLIIYVKSINTLCQWIQINTFAHSE